MENNNENKMTKESKFQDLKPTIVLVAITFVVTILLVLTNSATKPVIKDMNEKSANEARAEVLPSGTAFTKIENKTVDILDVYKEDSNKGYAITAMDKGFGGEIQVMVGFDNDKNITGVKVLSHNETPGLGTKATDPIYLEKQYNGKAKIEVEGSEKNIDTITGATVTSMAVYRAIEKAIECVGSL